MTERATQEERLAFLDLAQRYQWLYGVGLQTRLATQREDIAKWWNMGGVAKVRAQPNPKPAPIRQPAPPHIPDRVREIIAAVAQERGVSPADITGYQRTGRIAEARQEVYRRLREMTWGGSHPSLIQIGMWLHRDHTTIIDGMRR